MKKYTVLTFSLLLLFCGLVQADSPSQQQVIVKEQIAVTPQTVWEVIKNFHDMSWHPAVIKTEGAGNNEIGAKRVLTLGGGGKIHEKLEQYDNAKHTYFYRIEEVDVKVLPVTDYSSWLSVAAAPDGGSIVTWKGVFYRGYPNSPPPPELNDQAAVDAITGVYQGGLSNLKKILEQGS